MGGFESATHVDRSHRRQDYVCLTQHDRFLREDYERARAAGLRVIREALRWYLCDRDWRRDLYDFDSFAPFVDAAQRTGLTHITCLLHYGLPDGLDLFQPDFPQRFAAFAGAFARWRVARDDPPRWYVTVNELSFFALAAGENAWFAPFRVGDGSTLKAILVRAAIDATDAVRAEDPHARFVSIDPLEHRVASPTHPELRDEAARPGEALYHAWDMLVGRRKPELGGRPDYLDVIGVNSYPDSQTVIDTQHPLPLDDPRRRQFRDMLLETYQRFHRPIIVAETAARADERPVWLRYVVDECLAALRLGVDLQGICLYPLVDMREWRLGQIGTWGTLGLWDVREDHGTLHRIPNERYLAALAEVQSRAAASGLLPVFGEREGPSELASEALRRMARGPRGSAASPGGRGQSPQTPTSPEEHPTSHPDDLTSDIARLLRSQQHIHRR